MNPFSETENSSDLWLHAPLDSGDSCLFTFIEKSADCLQFCSLNKHIGLGYVTNPNDKGGFDVTTSKYVKSGNYEIEIAGMRYQIIVSVC